MSKAWGRLRKFLWASQKFRTLRKDKQRVWLILNLVFGLRLMQRNKHYIKYTSQFFEHKIRKTSFATKPHFTREIYVADTHACQESNVSTILMFRASASKIILMGYRVKVMNSETLQLEEVSQWVLMVLKHMNQNQN